MREEIVYKTTAPDRKHQQHQQLTEQKETMDKNKTEKKLRWMFVTKGEATFSIRMPFAVFCSKWLSAYSALHWLAWFWRLHLAWRRSIVVALFLLEWFVLFLFFSFSPLFSFYFSLSLFPSISLFLTHTLILPLSLYLCISSCAMLYTKLFLFFLACKVH